LIRLKSNWLKKKKKKHVNRTITICVPLLKLRSQISQSYTPGNVVLYTECQDTLSVLQDPIPEVLTSLECHMNMVPILKGYGDLGVCNIWNVA